MEFEAIVLNEITSIDLITKIGGVKKVSEIVYLFYKKVSKSKLLHPLFKDIDLDNLIKFQIKLFSAILGSISRYNINHLNRIHKKLHITKESFIEFKSILEETLLEIALDPGDVTEISKKIMVIEKIIFDNRELTKVKVSINLKKKLGIEDIEKLPEIIIAPLANSIIEFEKENYRKSIQSLYNSYCNVLMKELFPSEGAVEVRVTKSIPHLLENLKLRGIIFDDTILNKFNQITYNMEDLSPEIEVLESSLNDAKYIFEWYIKYYKSKKIDLEKIAFDEVNNQLFEDIKKTNLIEIPNNFHNTINMEFNLIPAGEFVMGALPIDKEANEEEHPIRKVRITKRFYISKFLTTQANWKSIMKINPSYFKKLGEDHPIEKVNWFLVQDFINKLNQKENLTPKDGYRLPTEAEWEYVCKAGSLTKYYYGNNPDSLDEFAWFSYSSNRSTKAVGTKKPNAFGIYDMLGNVKEWCQDWYNPTYYERSPLNDPKGPPKGDYKVTRGGSWHCVPRLTRTTQRSHYTPSSLSFLIGFRVIKQVDY